MALDGSAPRGDHWLRHRQPNDLGAAIAVYAAISKELGIPLRFPGSPEANRVLYQVSSADLLAAATVWAGVTPAARDEIFNITNGDQFRWQYMWPHIAHMFEMDIAEPEPVPMPLSSYLTDKADLWREIATKMVCSTVLRAILARHEAIAIQICPRTGSRPALPAHD